MTPAEVHETIYQALRRLVVDDGMDPEDATDKALDSLTKAQLVTFVRPLVSRQAWQAHRLMVRRLERQAFSSHLTNDVPASDRETSDGTGAPAERRETSAEARRRLVDKTFPLPDGSSVAWGAATVEQHAQRAEWQRGTIASIAADAARHEQAIEIIKSHGVTCLDQVPGWGDLLDQKDAA